MKHVIVEKGFRVEMQILYWFVVMVLSLVLLGWLYCIVGIIFEWEERKQELKDKGWWML